MLKSVLRKWLPEEPSALKRYYRDENLSADLERQLARERGEASNLERSLYTARSYFAS